MRPLIGLTPDYDAKIHRLRIHEDYVNAVREAGGLPVLLPFASDEETLRAMLARVDGVLFTGGADIDPSYYGQERRPVCGESIPLRDEMEMALMRLVLADPDVPFLGICRGIQVMNAAGGGTLFQDITAERAASLEHSRNDRKAEEVHRVTPTDGTRLREILGWRNFGVNSRHHQGVRRPAPGMAVSGRAEDGLIEALEVKDRACGIGVQWHPETLYPHSEESRRLFRYLVENAAARRASGNERSL